MKKLLFIISLSLLGSGCSKRIYTPVESVRMVERIVKDTLIEWRLEREYVEINTPDTISTLSNRYSSTTALWSAGTLHHTLETRDDLIEIPVQYIETNTYDTIRVPYPVKGDTIEVRMSLRWWESFLMVVGGASALIFGARWLLRKI